MNKERIKQVWSKALILKNRAVGYYSIISLLMILRVFLTTFQNQSLGWGLFAVGMIVLAIVTIIDFKYIYGTESEILWAKNRTSNNLSNRVERIETKIDTLLNELKRR